MKKIRCVAFLLAAIMIVGSLAGCGKKEEEVKETKYIYEPTYYKFSDSAEGGGAYVSGDRVYFASNTNEEVTITAEDGSTYTDYDSHQVIQSVKLDGTDLQVMTEYKPMEAPEGSEGSSSIGTMQADKEGNLWVMENLNYYSFNLPEDFNPETDDQWNYYQEGGNQAYLRKLNPDGSENQSVNITEMMSALNPDENYMYLWINSFFIDDAGMIYLPCNGTNILVLDSNCNKIANIEVDNSNGNIICLNDGTITTPMWKENGGNALYPIDLSTKSLGEEIPLPTQYNNLYNGNGDYLYYYSTETALYGAKKDADPEKLLDWLSTDVDQENLSGISVQSFDKLVAVEYNWDENSSSIVELNRVEVTPENQRTELTMAVMWMSWEIRHAVLNFNRSNTEYRIVVQDYSEYNTEDDYSAGQQKLMTEIISGKVPDILLADDLPVRQYGAKGLLEDLTPYIENDTELGGMDALVRPVIEATKEDGKIYYVGDSFYISTAVASKRLMGNATGWTVQEMQEALKKLPEGATILSPYINQQDLLSTLLRFNLGSYINWETGECTFDQGDFARLLEFCAMAPKNTDDIDWETVGSDRDRLKQGKQLMFTWSFSDVWDLMYTRQNFGSEGVAYVGFPAEDRHGTYFIVSNRLAMSSKCKYKDAAWQFIRTNLLPKDDVWSFSVNKSNFDKLVKDAMTEETYVDENGVTQKVNKFGYYDDQTGQEVEVYAMSQAQYQELMDLINNTTKVMDGDETMLDIVMDAVQAFLDGQKTADDVAAEVQSRVKLYVNEQR